jgi:mono/diheme cytochrome c family protein
VIRQVAVGAVVAAAAFGVIAAVAGIEGGAGEAGEATNAPDTGARGAEPAPPEPAEIAAGRDVFARMGCGSCHALAAAGSRGIVGPDLSQRLGGHTRESVQAVILNPPADGPMPRDFGSRMSDRELDALAAFLIAARDG